MVKPALEREETLLGRAAVPELGRHQEPGGACPGGGTSRSRGTALSSSSRAEQRQPQTLLGAGEGGEEPAGRDRLGSSEENTWDAAKTNSRQIPKAVGAENESRDVLRESCPEAGTAGRGCHANSLGMATHSHCCTSQGGS